MRRSSKLLLLLLPVTLGAQADSTKVRTPFAFADWSWLNGNPRSKRAVFDSKFFTGEVRLDVNYVYAFNRPADHTLVGSSEMGRTMEVQLQQLGVGGDFHVDNVRARVMTQVGMYSTMTPRNDPTAARGQWRVDEAYRYLSEAYGGYHWNKLHGINLDAGIFMSYIGLFSYYNFDNWAYQPSYVSSNTPWYFNGVRLQVFPTDRLKIEPWIVNGWQSYGMFNEVPGLGLQVLWRPTERVSIHSNTYRGADWLGLPYRRRWHTDNSVQLEYREDSSSVMTKAALSLTADVGCESGAGVRCGLGRSSSDPAQYFVGAMAYNRLWFHRDRIGITLGGGFMNNPGRYLVLLPPINGATAFSGTPYFTQNPGDQFRATDGSATVDFMPDEYTTFRFELNHRRANVPYFSGRGGVTPPGGNSGGAGSTVSGWNPDLRRHETRMTAALLIKM